MWTGVTESSLFPLLGPDLGLHPDCGDNLNIWDRFLVLYAPCERATGHKQAGMFLLDAVQEAPTIWLALRGFQPLCYIYCTYK